jgi:chloramphenicol-sensitive protein RarD
MHRRNNGVSTIDTRTREGIIAGLATYLMWGFLPVYFVFVREVDATEVLAHRVLWAVPFGALILLARHQFPELGRALKHRSMLAWLSLSALFIAINWFIYIWAIQDGRILETSLGYYINPLTNMLVGVWLFGERLRPYQLVAVALATVGVLILTISGGVFPWVALSLAVTFTVYAALRKRVAIGGMPGLFIETLMLLPFAIAWLLYLYSTSQLAFASGSSTITFWLAMAGPITALPLLCFALTARRLPMTTIGFLQFLSPTIQFGTGIYYGEVLTDAHLLCFGFIWSAVMVFMFDALRATKKPLLKASAGA